MLRICNLNKNYKNFKLSIEDLYFESGKMYGLIGENGSGKTTFFKTVLGLENIDGGDIKIFDKKLEEKNKVDIFNKIGIAWDYSTLPEELKICEMSKVMERMYKNWDQVKFEKLINNFGINKNDKIKNLSRGNSNKLMFSLIISYNPKLLFLDEILANIDFTTRKNILCFLKEYTERGNTVILSSHNIDELSKYCDNIVILKDGRILIKDKVSNIKNNYQYYELSENEFNKISKENLIFKKIKNNKICLITMRALEGFDGRSKEIEIEDILDLINEKGLL